MNLICLFLAFSVFASEEFELNPKAIKNFGIECASYSKENFPQNEIVKSGHEKSIYQCEDGHHFSRIQFDNVKPGEMVVVKGSNYLRTVELSLDEGPSKGHGH